MSLYLSTADLASGLPKPYSSIPPRRRRSTPKASPVTAAATAISPRPSPPAPPVASSSRLPTPAVDLRQAYRPSRTVQKGGPSRCVRDCCERESLFGLDDDNGDHSGLSLASAWSSSSSQSPRRRHRSSPLPTSVHWTILLASFKAPSTSTPALVSSSVESSASSLLLTPPDERPAFAFTKSLTPAAGRRPRAGRDSLVQELEGGFEWALERAIGSLKGSLATASLPIRRRKRSRQDDAAANAAGSLSSIALVVAASADATGVTQRRSRTRSCDRLQVQHGSCPLTSPGPAATFELASAPSRVHRTLPAESTAAATSAQSRPRLASFFTLPPPALAFWPRTGSRSSLTASTPPAPAAVVLPWHAPPKGEAETYHSSLPLLPMSRPPGPAEILRPHFPVLRPRALERYVVFGHMRRAGKIGQASGGGGEGEWRRLRERGQPRAGGSGSGLRWEVVC